MNCNRKRIGLVGGISWVSTMEYYRYINEGVHQKLGGLHAAECVIYSLNFGDVQERGWEDSYELLCAPIQPIFLQIGFRRQ